MDSPSLQAAPCSPSLAPASKAARLSGPHEEGPPDDKPEVASEDALLEVDVEVEVDNLHKGKVPVLAHVPEAPVNKNPKALLQDEASIQPEEAYSKDEEALNTFLKLHPMLSLEATSQRTLQLVSGMFEKATMKTDDLVCVPKSHDDLFLSPPHEKIGERPCVNGERCIAQFIAKVRYGVETDFAFTCKEFLLPEEHQAFLKGGGLPHRCGKCLLCTRYFVTYAYILARNDPTFKIGETSIQPQAFCNPVTNLPPCKSEEESNVRDASRIPTHACSVNAKDGYKPSATLFVDEDWAKLRSCREENLGKLLFRPTVKFCSTHYKYIKDEDGLRIVQVGISADDASETASFFGVPPGPEVAAPAAK